AIAARAIRDRRLMPQIRSVCVYCGSAGAVDPRYRAAADELGRSLAVAGIALVFGGGRIGLMGIAADAALRAGGHVVGIIPAAFACAAGPHRRAEFRKISDPAASRHRSERRDADGRARTRGAGAKNSRGLAVDQRVERQVIALFGES